MNSQSPNGMALYIRALNEKRHGKPKALAKQLADNGLKWCAIGGPWHESGPDRWMSKPPQIALYAEALSDAGVQPHVWGYPWHDSIDQFIEDMVACTEGSTIVGWLLDPELGLKKHPQAARELFTKSREALKSINPYNYLGFTSYGLPHGHQSFPFEEFADPESEGDMRKECDYGSPQLYFMNAKQIERGLTDYDKLGFDEIIPSFGNYKFVKLDANYEFDAKLPNGKHNKKAVSKTPNELDHHIADFDVHGIDVHAMIGWAYNFVNKGQWRVMAEYAERLQGGALVSPYK